MIHGRFLLFLRAIGNLLSQLQKFRTLNKPLGSIDPVYENYLLPIPSSRTTMSSDGLSVELTAPNGTKYTQPAGLFINNEFVKAKSGERITSINPTDESEITSVDAAGAEDVDIAVAAARKAFKTWRDVVPTDRGGMMLKLADLGTLSYLPALNSSFLQIPHLAE